MTTLAKFVTSVIRFLTTLAKFVAGNKKRNLLVLSIHIILNFNLNFFCIFYCGCSCVQMSTLSILSFKSHCRVRAPIMLFNRNPALALCLASPGRGSASRWQHDSTRKAGSAAGASTARRLDPAPDLRIIVELDCSSVRDVRSYS